MMWPYSNITREEFEQKKDEIERIIIALGGTPTTLKFSYENKTTSIHDGTSIVNISNRCIYEFKGAYFTVGEVCFSRPMIVIECAEYEDVMYNRWEDAEPFPVELSHDELVNEVKYSMGILPYPED